ncbi:MAG TPA: FGGY family carbohydrate kinase, partial [Limnochordales bacterium]
MRTVQAVYLGLDLGTSGCRAAAFTEGGELVASARRPVETRRPAPGRAEQEPLDWERAAAAALQEVVARLRAAGEPGVVREVRSLTLTGQMAGLVLVDRAGANP